MKTAETISRYLKNSGHDRQITLVNGGRHQRYLINRITRCRSAIAQFNWLTEELVDSMVDGLWLPDADVRRMEVELRKLKIELKQKVRDAMDEEDWAALKEHAMRLHQTGKQIGYCEKFLVPDEELREKQETV